MRQNIFSFKEFSWGKLMDLMILPTSVGNKKGPRAWTLLTKAEGGSNRKPVFTTSLSQPPPWPPRCRAESWLCLTLRQAAGRAAALGPPAHGTRSSEGHIWACSQILALLWGHFSHLVAVFHKSVAVRLPALPWTAPPSMVSPDAKHSEWHQGTDPSQDGHGEKLCFLSCQACKTSVTRGCAGQMGFPFGWKGEISIQSGDLLGGIPCRVLATNPAANSMAAACSLLFPLAIHTIWVAGFEGIKENLPSYNLAFYFFIPCTVQ